MRLLLSFLLLSSVVLSAPLSSSSDEEIEIVPAELRQIIDGKVCLWLDGTVRGHLTVRRGSDVEFRGALTNGTSEDLIIDWRRPGYFFRQGRWELRRGETAYVPPRGIPTIMNSGPPPEAMYKVLFSARGTAASRARAISVTGKAKAPDFVGTGTVEVRLFLHGFIGTTQRPANFRFQSKIPVAVVE